MRRLANYEAKYMMHEAITSYKSKMTKMHLANFLPQEARSCIGGGARGEKGGGT